MTCRTYLTGLERRDLDNLDPPVRERIVVKLLRFAETDLGDVKKLQGQTDRRCLRVGDWRVLFRVESRTEGDALLVLRVLHRGQAYR